MDDPQSGSVCASLPAPILLLLLLNPLWIEDCQKHPVYIDNKCTLRDLIRRYTQGEGTLRGIIRRYTQGHNEKVYSGA